MVDTLGRLGMSVPEKSKSWKRAVQKKIQQVHEQRMVEETASHPTLKYYPGKPQKNEIGPVRSRTGSIVTKIRVGDRALTEMHAGKICSVCGQQVNEVAPHVVGLCTQPEDGERTEKIKNCLRFQRYKHMKAVRAKYDRWVAALQPPP